MVERERLYTKKKKNQAVSLGGRQAHGRQRTKREGLRHLPTLTDVLASSSDALLPPTLLDVLIRLLLLGAGRSMALKGRWDSVPGPGEDGGEAMVGERLKGRAAQWQLFGGAARVQDGADSRPTRCDADQARTYSCRYGLPWLLGYGVDGRQRLVVVAVSRVGWMGTGDQGLVKSRARRLPAGTVVDRGVSHWTVATFGVINVRERCCGTSRVLTRGPEGRQEGVTASWDRRLPARCRTRQTRRQQQSAS